MVLVTKRSPHFPSSTPSSLRPLLLRPSPSRFSFVRGSAGLLFTALSKAKKDEEETDRINTGREGYVIKMPGVEVAAPVSP